MGFDYETLRRITSKYQEYIITGATLEAQKLKPELHQKLQRPNAVEYLIGLGRVLKAVKEGGKIEDVISRLKNTRLTQGENIAITHLETLLAEKGKAKGTS